MFKLAGLHQQLAALIVVILKVGLIEQTVVVKDDELEQRDAAIPFAFVFGRLTLLDGLGQKD